MSATPDEPGIDAREVVAVAALTAYSLVVAAGFARVYSGWEFLTDFALVVIAIHAGSYVLRRLGVRSIAAIPILLAGGAWIVAAQNETETFWAVFPTRATWDLSWAELSLVIEQFPTAVAPVLYGAGWATVSGLIIVVTTVLADTFAFRAEARGEALIPGGVMFVFVAALGTNRDRIALTAVLLGAGLVAVVALRRLHEHRPKVLRGGSGGRELVVPATLGIAVVVAVGAAFVGPRLPGADEEALIDTRNRGGGVTRVVSPLVEIRSRLTNQSNLELFRVEATAASYWRVTSLPAFDGESFRLPERDVVGLGTPGTSGDETIRQRIQILALGGNLLPAAPEPIQADGRDLQFQADTGTLVNTGDSFETGELYEVVSSPPRIDAGQLVSADIPPDPIYLELPELPSVVAQTAALVTADATDPYQQALALQAWFRDGFRYSTEVQSGHGTSAIESFLRERVGYCEQFAATFAAMARTLGIPSRVAVGYTPGLLGDDGWYTVLGKNAHAWPELWFDGVGWVLFEPTPGRGAPGAQAYTGIAPQQDDSGNTGTGSGDDVFVAPTAPPPVLDPGALPPSDGLDVPALNIPDLDDPGLVDDPISEPESSRPTAAYVIVLLIAVAVVAPAVFRRVRRWRARSKSDRDQVITAWIRATRAAEQAGVTPERSMTPQEWADATAEQLPIAARPMRSLATSVDLVAYAPPDQLDLTTTDRLQRSAAMECLAWSRQVERVANDSMSTTDRLRRYFADWN